MSSIGGEKMRWISTKNKLAEDKLSLLGDMILATAFVTYLGPFDGTYREKIMSQTWMPLAAQFNIRVTPNFNLKEILGDVEKLADWGLKGLPNTLLSYENMIIIEETRKNKFPVLIDPQGQALKFCRQLLS